MCDHFQMLRIAAQALVAQVVDLFLAGDVAEVVGVGHDVDGNGLPIETHAAIPTTSPSPRGRSSPEVTWGSLVVELEAGVYDVAAGLDFLDDERATISLHGKHMPMKSAL
jgi:hypothetical protein